MANFMHYSNVNSLFKKKNEQVWRSRNQEKLASPTPSQSPLPGLKRKFSFKTIIGVIVLLLLLVGGVSAMVLSQLQQDVRQRATGCTYWNGTAASEGAYDNRGGVRQQCVNGYWTVPDDGNLDPSAIIAAQDAARPKRDCVAWNGSTVPNGSFDNRGGIRQQCKDGLWDVPDDGNLDPSGLPQEEKPVRGCVNWAGQNVESGAYDNRGGIRQQCVDGLWDNPDDGITNPNDADAIALSEANSGLGGGSLEYTDARAVYDQYCRTNVATENASLCQNLSRTLTTEEQRIRFQALNDRVTTNTDQVSFAIGGLDDRSMDYAEASGVYREFCTGANAQQTSVSVCQALRSGLEEIATEREAAELARYTVLDETVAVNNTRVTSALSSLSAGTMDLDTANDIYQQFCQGSGAQLTSVTACSNLGAGISLVQSRTAAVENAEAVNNGVVMSALTNTNSSLLTLTRARNVYTDYCTGSEALYTSDALCSRLSAQISLGVSTGLGGGAVGAVSSARPVAIASTRPSVRPSARPSAAPVPTNRSGQESGQNLLGTLFNLATDYVTNTVIPIVRTNYFNAQSEQATEFYSTAITDSCQCNGSYLGIEVSANLGDAGIGNDNECYQCYPANWPDGTNGCVFFRACGYSTVTDVDSAAESSLVRLQLENPDDLFLVSDLTDQDQVAPVTDVLNLMPDSLTNNRPITYLIGDAGSSGGLSSGAVVYVGAPLSETYTQNPEVSSGYAMSIVAHETLHSLDDTEVCDSRGNCSTYLELFEVAAEESGYVFESEFSEMEVDGESDFLLYNEYPTNSAEGFAITGAAYMLAPDQLREERPELYEFYRDTIFDGVEYIEIYNSDCNTTRIEVRSSATEQTQSSMNAQCMGT